MITFTVLFYLLVGSYGWWLSGIYPPNDWRVYVLLVFPGIIFTLAQAVAHA